MEKLNRELQVGDYFYPLSNLYFLLDCDESIPLRVNSIDRTSHLYCSQVIKITNPETINVNFRTSNIDISRTNRLLFNNLKIEPKLPIL